MKPERGLLRAWPGVAVCLLVPCLLVLIFSNYSNKPELSPLEAQMVGEWYSEDPNETRSFHSDRTFSTSNGQFVGIWEIKDGRLQVTYRQSVELPREYSFAGVAHSLRRIRKDTCSWDITFAEDGQLHTLSVPATVTNSEGPWVFYRVGHE